MADLFVLAVEDDSKDVLLLEREFGKVGLRGSVHFVQSGEQVMDYLLGIAPYDDRAKYPFPNLLLVDLKMPGMDGFQLLEWLQKRGFRAGRPAVAVLTGSYRQEDFERAHALGADFCLSKATDLQELVGAIKSMAAGKH
jgi:CheY-like chemotaxis protein